MVKIIQNNYILQDSVFDRKKKQSLQSIFIAAGKEKLIILIQDQQQNNHMECKKCTVN